MTARCWTLSCSRTAPAGNWLAPRRADKDVDAPNGSRRNEAMTLSGSLRPIAAILACALLCAGCAAQGADGRPGPAEARAGTAGRWSIDSHTGMADNPRPARARIKAAAAARRRPFRFAVIGDWGSGLRAEQRVARAMCRYRRSHNFNFVVTTGDNIYEEGRRSLFRRKFYRPFRCLLRAGVRWHSVLGNHDVEWRQGRDELRATMFGAAVMCAS